jgi:hypothetical protein
LQLRKPQKIRERSWFKMKKPKSKTKPTQTSADVWLVFPKKIEDWTKEDHALEMLLRGLRISPRSSANSLPLPPMLYVPAMTMFFDWFASEISEKENQDAAERLYYLALLSVRNLLDVCHARPDLFRPIARHQLYWPSMTGWGADVERTNRELMKTLNLSEAAPLNTARNGRKAFSILGSPETQIACSLWGVVEFFRREEQGIYSGDPACSLVLPDLPDIHNVRKLGLTDEHIEKLKSLQPLSRRNFLEWWKLGEPAFIHRYGKDFENHKNFSGYWKNKAFKDDPKARTKIRSAIKKQIKQAFRSIAPKSSDERKTQPLDSK